jgi:hypothetical protein
MRPALPLLLLAVSVHAGAATPAVETRAATAQEMQSFDAYYHALHPDAAPVQPVFDIVRQPRGRGWSVAAHIDAAPLRAAPALCRINRGRYDYQAGAPKRQRWSARSPGQQFVWLAHGAACTAAPAQAVELTQPLPDADIVSLLQQHPALMQRARLLLAGNTQCATLRSLPFHPIALGLSTPAAGAAMYSITFESDRASTAQVTVRKSGAEFSAWNVSCPAH